MTINEYMKVYNLTYKQVRRRIDNGKLAAVKKGKSWEIITDDVKTSVKVPKAQKRIEKGKIRKRAVKIEVDEDVDAEELSEKLKNELLAVRIKKLEQDLKVKQSAIEEKFKVEILDGIFEALNQLPEVFRKCKLNKKQARLIQNALNESIASLKKL